MGLQSNLIWEQPHCLYDSGDKFSFVLSFFYTILPWKTHETKDGLTIQVSNLCSLVNLSHFFGTKWIYRTHFFSFAESVMSSGDIDDNTAEERIQKLNRLYVEANKTAETDKSIEAIARSRFSRLEQGDQDLVRQVFGSLTKYFLYTLNLTI